MALKAPRVPHCQNHTFWPPCKGRKEEEGVVHVGMAERHERKAEGRSSVVEPPPKGGRFIAMTMVPEASWEVEAACAPSCIACHGWPMGGFFSRCLAHSTGCFVCGMGIGVA